MIKNSHILKLNTLMEISKVIGEAVKGSQIDEVFKMLRLSDNSKETTKWRRINYVLKKYQTKNKTSKTTICFIEAIFMPVNYLKCQEEYKYAVNKVNQILVTEGYLLNIDGKIIEVEKTTALTELQQRFNNLIEKLKLRGVHPEVLKYCTVELLNDNYFHSVFEAAKSLSERVRELSGVEADGSDLFNSVFSVNNPILKYNSLSNTTEKNQQNGLKEMLHGITHYIRNVTAHEPKIKWLVEEDAAVEILMVISFLHSALDNCEKV